jgi:hypothetical protein
LEFLQTQAQSRGFDFQVTELAALVKINQVEPMKRHELIPSEDDTEPDSVKFTVLSDSKILGAY